MTSASFRGHGMVTNLATCRLSSRRGPPGESATSPRRLRRHKEARPIPVGPVQLWGGTRRNPDTRRPGPLGRFGHKPFERLAAFALVLLPALHQPVDEPFRGIQAFGSHRWRSRRHQVLSWPPCRSVELCECLSTAARRPTSIPGPPGAVALSRGKSASRSTVSTTANAVKTATGQVDANCQLESAPDRQACRQLRHRSLHDRHLAGGGETEPTARSGATLVCTGSVTAMQPPSRQRFTAQKVPFHPPRTGQRDGCQDA